MCFRATWVDIRSVEKPEVEHSDAQPPHGSVKWDRRWTTAGQRLGGRASSHGPSQLMSRLLCAPQVRVPAPASQGPHQRHTCALSPLTPF